MFYKWNLFFQSVIFRNTIQYIKEVSLKVLEIQAFFVSKY